MLCWTVAVNIADFDVIAVISRSVLSANVLLIVFEVNRVTLSVHENVGVEPSSVNGVTVTEM